MFAQQTQDSVDALPPGFNRALYDGNATAEEIIRSNPDAWKINDKGILMVNGKEVHQMLINGKVVYSEDDTITDSARLLEEITRRVKENNSSTEPTIAHIDDRQLFPEYEANPYRIPEGESIEDIIRKLPGAEIHEDGSVTVNGKPVNPGHKVGKNEYVIEVEPSLVVSKTKPEVKKVSFKRRHYTISEGATLKDFLSQLPVVKENTDGKLITKKRKEPVSTIVFNGDIVYRESQGFTYPEDYNLKSGTILITIEDKKFYDEIPWLSLPDDLPEGSAKLVIRYYPGENEKQALRHMIIK